MLVMRIPASKLANLIGAPENLSCIPIRQDEVSGGFTSSTLKQVWNQMQHSDNNDQAQFLERMIFDSLAVSLGNLAENKICQSSLQRGKRIRVVSYIEENLTDADLNPNQVAGAFDISTRYLHKLFSAQGESVSQYILRRRLEQAAELLPRTASNGQTISEVAFRLGFNSQTHFGRVFREKYGLTPKAFLREKISL
jgi:AraC-like DNA-binding protein